MDVVVGSAVASVSGVASSVGVAEVVAVDEVEVVDFRGARGARLFINRMT